MPVQNIVSRMSGGKPLTGESLEKAKAVIKDAILIADKVIYDPSTSLNAFWDKYNNLMEDLFTFGALRETKARWFAAYQMSLDNWEAGKKTLFWTAANNGTVDNKPMTDKQAEVMLELIQDNIKSVSNAVTGINLYATGKIIDRAILEYLGAVAKKFKEAGDAVGDLLSGLLKVLATVGKFLPWIVGALILGPFLLRTFAGFKRGGAAGAAEEAAGQLERGRSAVASGARSIVTRGMAGAPRRRRSLRSR